MTLSWLIKLWRTCSLPTTSLKYLIAFGWKIGKIWFGLRSDSVLDNKTRHPEFFETATIFYGLTFRPHLDDETVTENGTFRRRSSKWNFSKTPFFCSRVDASAIILYIILKRRSTRFFLLSSFLLLSILSHTSSVIVRHSCLLSHNTDVSLHVWRTLSRLRMSLHVISFGIGEVDGWPYRTSLTYLSSCIIYR